MPGWEQLLLGGVALLALWLFAKPVGRAVKEAPKGSAGDWLGLLVPLALVVGFVVLLVALI